MLCWASSTLLNNIYKVSAKYSVLSYVCLLVVDSDKRVDSVEVDSVRELSKFKGAGLLTQVKIGVSCK